MTKKEIIDSLWHNAKKEMPECGKTVLIISCEGNLYLCKVDDYGKVKGPRGYIWNIEMRYWLDTDDLFSE